LSNKIKSKTKNEQTTLESLKILRKNYHEILEGLKIGIWKSYGTKNLINPKIK